MATEMAVLAAHSASEIEKRVGVTNDNAIILLVAFGWNEKYIRENYENLACGLARRSGLNLHFDPRSDETNCSFCGNTRWCTTRGCDHFLCDRCLRVYGEGRIQAGE